MLRVFLLRRLNNMKFILQPWQLYPVILPRWINWQQSVIEYLHMEYGRSTKEITADQKERSQRIVETKRRESLKIAKVIAEKERRRQEENQRQRLKEKQKEEESQQRRQKWKNDLLKQLSPVFSESKSAKQKFGEWLESKVQGKSDEQRHAWAKLDNLEHPWVCYRLRYDHHGNKYKVGPLEYLEFHEIHGGGRWAHSTPGWSQAWLLWDPFGRSVFGPSYVLGLIQRGNQT